DKLKAQECTYCHQPDAERRFMLPLRYEAHCAGCHPLQIRPVGDYPADKIAEWMATPLPHPARGQKPGIVRGALFEKYTRLLTQPPPPGTPLQPLALNRTLTPEVRDKAKELGRVSEALVFASTPAGMEDDLFRRGGYCLYCPTENQ